MNATATPWAPWGVTPADGQKIWADFTRKWAAMPGVVEAAKNSRVGATPTETSFSIDRIKLLHYVTDCQRQFDTPLLVVFALINRPYILDLREGKSVVRHFIDAGFDTYNVDWGVPTQADRHLGMRDYILRYMDSMVDHLREKSGQEKINLLGYCMGGSMSAMYTALFPEKIKNLIQLAAPVDWTNRDHLLAKFTDPRYFDVDRLIDVHGNAPADMLQWSFTFLKPVSNLVEKWFNFYEHMEDPKYLENFFAMETWLNDNIPVAGEMFREFVKYCMQENRLIQGRLEIGGRRVDLKQIQCPVLNLMAEHDHLVPCGLSAPLNDAIGSSDEKAVRFPAGHIGMAVSSKAHRELWPEAAKWLSQRTEPATRKHG